MVGFPFPDRIHELLRVVNGGRLLYRSDYSVTPGNAESDLAKDMEEGMRDLWSGEEGEENRRAVWEGSARRLLGRRTA